MATSSSNVTNLNSTENTVKKKYVKKRSKAYRKRRSIRRKKNNFYNSKRLLRYFVRKTKKLKMNNSIDTNSMLHENSDRCSNSDEIGYWKSQVLSLQFENEMLCDYINELHSQLINSKKNIVYNENLLGKPQEGSSGYNNGYQYGGNGHKTDEYGNNGYESNQYANDGYGNNLYVNNGYENADNNECVEYEGDEDDDEFNKESKQFRLEREERKKKVMNERDDDPSGKPPERVTGKRDEVMKKLYGKGWRKIMGMETVVQLNFEITKDKEKINYWPIVPIKL